MNQKEIKKIREFFAQTDADGISNEIKANTRSREICRTKETNHNQSYEESLVEKKESEYPAGVVIENDKCIGLGIHILNEDIYPLQQFRIFLRNCDLVGTLDLSECKDLKFLDLYHNKVTKIITKDMPMMRIFGVQDNELTSLDTTGLLACQGIDAGRNHLRELDTSKNRELVELYINDNEFEMVDLSANQKLKYFYCHNNRITLLDVTANPLLRHMDATGNPMREILAWAPQREERMPLNLIAGEGGAVGLKFNPIYNAQWKETGEWQQSYHAYPKEGYQFVAWQNADGTIFSTEENVVDTYGESRVLTAIFQKKVNYREEEVGSCGCIYG